MMKPKKPVIKLLRSVSNHSDLGLCAPMPVYISDMDVCELSAKAIANTPVASANESTGCRASPDQDEVERALSMNKPDMKSQNTNLN